MSNSSTTNNINSNSSFNSNSSHCKEFLSSSSSSTTVPCVGTRTSLWIVTTTRTSSMHVVVALVD